MRSFRMEKCVILLCLALVGSWTPQGLSAAVNQSPDFCKLMPESGPGPSCTAYIPQFFFNSTSQKCEEFIYGGCGGNQNRFDSKKKCLETCHPHPIHEEKSGRLAEACVLTRSRHNWDMACNLPPNAGPCLGYFPSYFYNATSGSCEIFIYGGCGGNTNRFKHLTSCQMYCRAPVPKSNEVCNLPPKTGPCKASFHKLFYNSHSQRCEPFIYGGCDGNANRFDSAEECQDVCQPGDNDVMIPLAVPEEANRRSLDVCDLPPETGSCRMNIPRFFYNSTSKKCEPFTYGGCEGNKNRFVSKRECHLRCPDRSREIQPTEKPGSDVCLLPSDSGPCEALIPRFYYNHQTQKCTEFVYGGCQGNKNNFIDEEQCNKICKKD